MNKLKKVSVWCKAMKTDETAIQLVDEKDIHPTPEKKNSVKAFFDNALQTIKGRDINQMMEEFTAEVSLVAQGLSQDQERLDSQQAQLYAQQTLMEEQQIQCYHDLDCKLQVQAKQLDDLQKQLAQLDKRLHDKHKKNKEGITSALRQATWLAALLAGAWVLTTIINLFKG